MTTAPPADKKTATKTAYHIFRQVPNDQVATSYEPVEPNVEASSAAEAIRLTVKTAGTFVAVPARSWKPVKVTVEQTTVVKVGDAT
jgi:hypothetical protein